MFFLSQFVFIFFLQLNFGMQGFIFRRGVLFRILIFLIIRMFLCFLMSFIIEMLMGFGCVGVFVVNMLWQFLFMYGFIRRFLNFVLWKWQIKIMWENFLMFFSFFLNLGNILMVFLIFFVVEVCMGMFFGFLKGL